MKRGTRSAAAGVVALSLVLSGCATIFSGTNDTIVFESEPAGARVLIDGVDQGVTPLTTSVKRSLGGVDVTYRLDGYETRTFDLGQEFNTVTIANIFCLAGFWVCGGIDVLTGAVMKYSPRSYNITLDARDMDTLEESLDVEEVLFEDELERDALGNPTTDQIRPNVALVNSATKQIIIIR